MAIFQKPPKSIIVQTRKGSDIKNEQVEAAFSFGKLRELTKHYPAILCCIFRKMVILNIRVFWLMSMKVVIFGFRKSSVNGGMPTKSFMCFPIVRITF